MESGAVTFYYDEILHKSACNFLKSGNNSLFFKIITSFSLARCKIKKILNPEDFSTFSTTITVSLLSL